MKKKKRKFSPDKPCEAVHYEKHRAVFLLPEPKETNKFWMVMSINNPYVMKTKESKTIPEYKENEIDDISLSKVLSHLYKVFRVTEKKNLFFFLTLFQNIKVI